MNAGTPKAALLGMFAAWLLRVPVRIYIVRGLRGETATGLTRRILGWTKRISSFCATHILFVSKSLREVYLELGLGPARKAVVLLEGSSKGVDVERFRARRSGSRRRASSGPRWGSRRMPRWSASSAGSPGTRGRTTWWRRFCGWRRSSPKRT